MIVTRRYRQTKPLADVRLVGKTGPSVTTTASGSGIFVDVQHDNGDTSASDVDSELLAAGFAFIEENPATDVDDADKQILRNTTTGMISAAVDLLAINVGNSGTFDVKAGSGKVIDISDPLNPVPMFLTWPAFTAVVPTFLATSPFSVIWIEDSGDGKTGQIFQDTTPPPNPVLRRTKIKQGVLLHPATTIIAAPTLTTRAYDDGGLLGDLVESDGDKNVRGNEYAANGANLLLNKSVGVVFGPDVNPDPASPNILTAIALVGVTSYICTFRDGSQSFSSIIKSEIDPNVYDDGSGSLVAMPNNRFQIFRLLFSPRSPATPIFMEAGQALYMSLSAGLEGINQNGVEINPQISGNILVGWLVIKEGVTDIEAAISGGDAEFRVNHGQLSQGSGSNQDAAAIHVNTPGEIATIAPTPLALDDQLVFEDKSNGDAKGLATPQDILDLAPASPSVSLGGSSSQADAVTPIVVTGVTVTPGAGTYTVTYWGDTEILGAGDWVEFAVYADGVLQTNSLVRYQIDGRFAAFLFIDGVVVTAGQAIDVRLLTNDATGITSRNRRLVTSPE